MDERYAEENGGIVQKRRNRKCGIDDNGGKMEKTKKFGTRGDDKEEDKDKGKGIGYKDWWNRCTKGKRGIKKMYWRWRKGKINRSRYLEERKKFKTTLEEVQKEKRTKEEEELRNMKREAEV